MPLSKPGRALRSLPREGEAPPALLGGEARFERDADGREWIVLPRGAAMSRPVTAGLVLDLEAVGRPRDARAFVRRHGLLTHGPSALDAPSIREAWTDWQLEAARLRMIATIVVQTYRALDPIGVEVADPTAVELLRVRLRDLDGPKPLDDLDFLRAASHVVEQAINERLADARWAITTEALPEGRPNIYAYRAQAITEGALTHAYLQLADLLVARAPLAECEGCGRIFERKHGNQRFHDDACRQRAGYERRKEATDDDGLSI